MHVFLKVNGFIIKTGQYHQNEIKHEELSTEVTNIYK